MIKIKLKPIPFIISSIIVLSSGYFHSTKMGTPTHFLNTPDLKLKGSFVIRGKKFQDLIVVVREHSVPSVQAVNRHIGFVVVVLWHN